MGPVLPEDSDDWDASDYEEFITEPDERVGDESGEDLGSLDDSESTEPDISVYDPALALQRTEPNVSSSGAELHEVSEGLEALDSAASEKARAEALVDEFYLSRTVGRGISAASALRSAKMPKQALKLLKEIYRDRTLKFGEISTAKLRTVAGASYADLGQWKEASSLIERVLLDYPNDSYALRVRARIHHSREDWQKAEDIERRGDKATGASKESAN